MMHGIRFEWRYTYQSARRDGWSRKYSAKRFIEELSKRWAENLGLRNRGVR
jgi:hypothetical protein